MGPIERAVRGIKERTRSTLQALPYERIPKIMTKELISGVVNILNAFPVENGISDTLSPGTIVDGRRKLNLINKRINFGAYAHIHTGTHNSMKSRSVPCIALRTSNNNGGYYFMNLESGKRMHSYNWTELPITESAIARVHELAKNEQEPRFLNGNLKYEWMEGQYIQNTGRHCHH